MSVADNSLPPNGQTLKQALRLLVATFEAGFINLESRHLPRAQERNGRE